MGQQVTLVVAPDQTVAPPQLPECPKSCNYQMARFTTPLTAASFGNNSLLAPPDKNTDRRRRLMGWVGAARSWLGGLMR
jgi:hypothetical protein